MTCPKCGHEQPGGEECLRCGVIFARIRETPEPSPEEAELAARVFGNPLENLLRNTRALLVDQDPRGWLEVLLSWEVANQYTIQDGMGRIRGFVVEQGRGFAAAMRRTFLGSHRPLHLAVFSPSEQEIVLELHRPWFFLLSEMTVTSGARTLGTIRQKLSLVRASYELRDRNGVPFARILRRFFGIWTFPIYDMQGQPRGEIVKKWSGLGREYFTDADKFRVDFGDAAWTLDQRAILFAAALTIDFDVFENNRKR